MNTTLEQLLAECGFQWKGDIWDRAILIRNYGSVPEPAGVPVDSANRGFRLVLLGDDGKATHFARCDTAANPQFKRECAILVGLQSVQALAGSIPRIRTAAAGALRVQVMPFVSSPSFTGLISPFGPQRWLRHTREILDLTRQVGIEVDRLLAKEKALSSKVSVQDEVGRDLPRLEAFGIPAASLHAIVDALREMRPLPRELQHGDMWPDNVLRRPGGWQLIDFAEFGDVNVPLYDMWHMIRYRPRNRVARLPVLRNGWDSVARQLIASEAARLGLSPEEVGATRLFSLVHMASYRLRHGVPFEFAEPYTRAVATAGEQIATGAATLVDFAKP
jgi:hypothetical protein